MEVVKQTGTPLFDQGAGEAHPLHPEKWIRITGGFITGPNVKWEWIDPPTEGLKPMTVWRKILAKAVGLTGRK